MNTHDGTNPSPTRPEYPASLAGPRPDGQDTVPPAADHVPTHLSREQILDATEHCLNELGYDKTTIRAIAQRLNCAVGSIYRYFKGKRSLLDAVTQRRFEPVVADVLEGLPLEKTLQRYAQIATEQPEQYRLMHWLASVGQVDGNAGAKPEAGLAAKPGASAGVPGVVRQIIEGWSRQIGDPQRAQRLWAQLHGHVMLGIHRDQIMRTLSQLHPTKLTVHQPSPQASVIDPLGTPDGTGHADESMEAPSGEPTPNKRPQPLETAPVTTGSAATDDMTLL